MQKLLEEQSQDQQNEIDKLKSNLASCEKDIDVCYWLISFQLFNFLVPNPELTEKNTYTQDCTLQHELEKEGILSELLNLQKEVLTLSSSSLMKEKESIRKELDRTKTKLRETETKLKNSVQEKIKLQVGYQLAVL
jgi:centromeric protein E